MSLLVKDVMTHEVVTIDEFDSVQDAAKKMSEKKISSILVESGESIQGILTEKDIVKKLVSENRSPSDTLAKEIMTSPMVIIDENDNLEKALRIMLDMNIKKLPVINSQSNDSMVCGIVSLFDITRLQPELLSNVQRNYQRVTSHVRHDLRNPLSIIQSALYLIENNPDNTHELLEKIKDASLYAQKIMDDWENESLQSELIVEEVCIDQLLQDTMNVVLLPDGIEISCIVDKDIIFPLDYNKMLRVLTNIVKNAVEAIPQGGEIILEAHIRESNLYLSVLDTGEGIPDEVIDKIFDPVFSTKSQGLGLGLDFVRKTVDTHGGKIRVVSEDNMGTQFIIQIPYPQK
jgi:signal transduction histidine kinase